MSGNIEDVLGDHKGEGSERRPRGRGRSSRRYVDDDVEVVRRPDGDSVPWIGLFAIAGVLATALTSVALGFVGDEPVGPANNAAAAAK